MSAFRIHSIEQETEEIRIKRYLIKRGLEHSDPLVLAIMNVRLKYHKEECHLVLGQLVSALIDNNSNCDGTCNPPCDVHRLIRRARDLMKWNEVPKEI